MIAEFQSELKVKIPRIVEFFAESSEHVRSGALIVIGSFVTQGR
jgi:hypothetical protein